MLFNLVLSHLKNIASMKNLTWLFVLICLTCTTNWSYAQKSLNLEALPVQSEAKTGVLAQIDQYNLFNLNAKTMLTYAQTRADGQFGLHVRFGTAYDWDMILQPSQVHGSDFKFILSTGGTTDAETNITYEGYLKNDPAIKVRMTISDNYIFGLILDADRHVFETVERTPHRSANDLVAVYKSRGLGAGIPTCGYQLPDDHGKMIAPEAPSLPSGLAPDEPNTAGKLLTATYCPKLGVTLDWQGLAKAGSLANFNADLQTIINVVNGYYAVFNVKYELNPVYVITASPNPWTDSPGSEPTLTSNFRVWAYPNLTPTNYNCALLFTGTNMNGISYAYFGHMCTTDGYRFGEIDYQYVQPITQRANITTHELGHLWGAQHTGTSSLYIMSPSIWDGTLQWDATSTSVISTAVNSTFTSCLPNCSNVAVALTSPTNNQVFINLNAISLAATATATTGSITQVEFFVGTTSVGVDNTSPFTTSWTPPAYGSYTLKAVATDNSGTTATQQISISVQVPGTCGTVTGLTSAAITTSGATLSWTAVSGATNYTVDYKLNTGSTWTTAASATTATSLALTGLTLNTLYDWRVKANCTGGVGAYTQAQFTTAANPTTLFAYGASWKYLDNGTNQGTAWFASAFNDAAWASGNGQLGYGDGDEATVVSYGANVNSKYVTTYFRKTISVNPAAYSSFNANVKRDDGIIVYLNGTEIYRNNMGTGAVTYTTLAALASDDGVTPQPFTIAPSAFIFGNNVLAVEIHQNAGSSSDISFDMELLGTLAPVTCGSVTGLASSALTTTGATVSWSALSGATSYSVDYKVNTASTWVNAATATTALNINLTGLAAGTLYDWRVRANCTGGSGVYTTAQFTTTPVATCGTVAGLTATALTTSGATIGWTTLSGANNYDVDYKLNTSSTWTNAATATTALSINLTGLTSGTLYDWRVRANCTGATGTYTSAQFTTTVPASCGTVTGLTTSAVTNAGATTSWTALSGANNYTVDYKVNTSSTWVNAASATTATSFSLSGLTAATLYDWRVRANCTGISGAYVQGQFTTGSAPPPAPTVIFNYGASWKYLDNGSNQGTGWYATSFSDAAWASGNGELGYGDYDETTVLSYGSNSSNKYITTYFRKTITIADPAAYSGFNATVKRDDGIIVYVNGTEVFRDNIGTGTVNYNTLAYLAYDDGVTPLPFTIPPGVFVAGNNVIAVEIHQTEVTSSDISFDMELAGTTVSGSCGNLTGLSASALTATSATISWTAISGASNYDVDYKISTGSGWTNAATATTATSVNLTGLSAGNAYDWRVRVNCAGGSNPYIGAQFATISQSPDFSYGASWKYLDNGSNQGTAWTSASYNDASWASGYGELGYGDYDETTVVGYGSNSNNKFVTTYFRKIVNVTDPTAFSIFNANVIRDDGIVVYVNGTEVYRDNMPSGTIAYNTLAYLAYDDGLTPQYFTISPGAFVAGNNLIAVEIHQTEVTSSDISFDMELQGVPVSGSCGTVTGLASGGVTTSGATLSWTALSGAGSYSVDYKVNTATSWTNATTATTATSVAVTGLAAGTLYDWRVRANCTGGNGAYSSAQVTTTAIPTCGTLTGLTAVVDTSSAIVSWTALNGANNYTVDYKLNTASVWTNAAAATTPTSVNLNGLAANTLYDWRVNANCTGATGAVVNAQFTTASNASCGAPTGLAASAITVNGATVSWTGLSGANNYTVDYKVSTASAWTNAVAATTSTTVNLTGLSAGTLYNWRVNANCTGATGAFVSAQFTTTISAGLSRGPYLNKATQDAIVIRWRTDVATDSKVNFGTIAGSLTQSVADNTVTTEHIVTVTGLTADTKYFYSVGSSGQTIQGDANNYFKTMPVVGSTQKIRFLAMGDMGNNSTNQVNVRNAWLTFKGTNYTDGWLLLGDNAYETGSDAEYQSNFYNIYQGTMTKNHVLWPAPGNHDYANNTSRQADHAIPYYNMFSLPINGEAGGVASNTEAFYSYNYGNVHFVALDSYGWESGSTRLYDTLGPQATWLKQDLTANTQQWTVVYFHHPPYTKGSHDSDTESELMNMRQKVVPILERYKVDMVLSGHSHCYERSYLINGHFGLENTFSLASHAVSASSAKYDGTANSCTYVKNPGDLHNGIVYAVVGSAGQLGGTSAGFPHNAMYYSDATNGGALYFEVENNRLSAKWIGADGVIRDNFNIMKNVNKTTNISLVTGNSVTLTAPWLGAYNWSNGATTASITVSPTASTTFSVLDGMGCITDVFNVTVTSAFQGSGLSGNRVDNTSGALWPNPVSSVLHVQVSDPGTAAGMEVVDLNGRVVIRESIFQSDVSLDVSRLTNGVYMLVLRGVEGQPLFNSRFIKE
jgi:hypothetical protein